MRNAQIEIRSSDVSDDLELIRLKRRFEKHLDVYRLHELEHAHSSEQLIREQENTARNITALFDICKVQSETVALQITAQNERIHAEAQKAKPVIDTYNGLNSFKKSIMWLAGLVGATGILMAFFTDYIKIGG